MCTAKPTKQINAFGSRAGWVRYVLNCQGYVFCPYQKLSNSHNNVAKCCLSIRVLMHISACFYTILRVLNTCACFCALGHVFVHFSLLLHIFACFCCVPACSSTLLHNISAKKTLSQIFSIFITFSRTILTFTHYLSY